MKTLKDMEQFTREDIINSEFVGIALQSRTKKASDKGLTCKVDTMPTFVYLNGLRLELIKQIKSGKMVEGAKFWAIDFFNITKDELEK